MRILMGNDYSVARGNSMAAFDDCGMTPEGEETYTFNLPLGYTVETELEDNNSTSVRLRDAGGSQVLFWNSGTFIACSILGAGVGLMVGSYAMNPSIGALAARMTSYGCSKAMNRTYEDGDEYIPPC